MPTQKLGVNQGTRLEMLTFHDNGVVRVWTAIRNKAADADRLEGTYLEIWPCGKVIQGGNDDEFEIRPCKKNCDKEWIPSRGDYDLICLGCGAVLRS